MRMFAHKAALYSFCIFTMFVSGDCSKTKQPPPSPPVSHSNEVDMWLTTGDQRSLIEKQTNTIYFENVTNGYPDISVDSAVSYQQIDGFGYTLTGSSAYLINHMDPAARNSLLTDLFSYNVSYLRISIGASDLSPQVFSYDDMPNGQTDPQLNNFTLSLDTVDLIPVLQQILAINPSIRIMGSPWSPPVWMKDNNSSIGGSLLPQYYDAYARYFVKYIQAMSGKGITVHAVTVQNEPQHGGNNPSMVMSATQEATFIKNNLGPAFQSAGISTKIVCWDHNCDNPSYPITVLDDPGAKQYTDGSAFHLYGGDISAMTTVHNAHPDRNLYFTEQWTSATGSFEGDLEWHTKNVIIGSIRNWSRNALEWNLANDISFSMHTPGGCDACKGAVTINGSTVVKNVSYYIISQVAKFVPAGSKRISSNNSGILFNVAFITPSGRKVLLIMNEGSSTLPFNIQYKGKRAVTWLPPSSVATYTW